LPWLGISSLGGQFLAQALDFCLQGLHFRIISGMESPSTEKHEAEQDGGEKRSTVKQNVLPGMPVTQDIPVGVWRMHDIWLLGIMMDEKRRKRRDAAIPWQIMCLIQEKCNFFVKNRRNSFAMKSGLSVWQKHMKTLFIQSLKGDLDIWENLLLP
jgi:hypothetical protein